MGQNKALLQLAGKSLLELALDKLRALPLAAAPRIAGAPSEHAGVVADLHPGCGPLSGIEAALAASKQALNVFLPVDMPQLPPDFLLWMLRRAQVTGAPVTVGRINGLPQPLCAVYHKHLLTPHHRIAACRRLQSYARRHRGRFQTRIRTWIHRPLRYRTSGFGPAL